MSLPVNEYMHEGRHADEVCAKYGLTREELAKWCNWMDFRVTWVDPARQPPVPSPAPDYAPPRGRERH